MQIVDNRALMLKVRNPDRITTVIPKSRVVDRDGTHTRVLVNWGLDESVVLKNLGYKKTPSPILRNYNWPGIHRPWMHQKTTAAFLTMHRRAFCFNEMGTAKTSSAIWAADYLMGIGAIKKVLIICPLSIMSSVWVGDLFKTAMHRTVQVAYSKDSDKRKAIITENHAEFMVINYDGVEVAKEELRAAKFDMIIVDECNAYKTVSTKRWKTLNSLLRPGSWLWMMTGTPAAQSPTDAYGLAKLVSPDNIPQFFGAFRDMVMWKVTNFRWVPKENAQDIVHKVLQPAIRFTKEECLELPPMTHMTREVALTPQQSKYYEGLRRQFTVQAAGEDITAVNAAANMNKMLQVCSGCVYSDSGDTIQFDSSSRLTALKEVIDESSHKVLVFANYKHSIEMLYEELTAAGYGAAVINGAVSAGRRTEIFAEFQKVDSALRVLIIQPQAASHGVTLHAANTIVYWTPVMSVETYLQCNGRVHRAGQRNPATVIHLQGSALERKIYAMLEGKIELHTKLIDLYKEELV